jgi:hypothetical protein
MTPTSPYERWKVMAPAYFRKVQTKQRLFKSRSIFAINCFIALLFSGVGLMYYGSLTSNYKWIILGTTFFAVSMQGGHFVIERFRERMNRYLYKMTYVKSLTEVDGLNNILQAIMPTTRPGAGYPKFLVKAGIVSQEYYRKLLEFQARFAGLQTVPVPLQIEWGSFQFNLLTNRPYLPALPQVRQRRNSI